MNKHLHVNKINFHMKGFTPVISLKRAKSKWAIGLNVYRRSDVLLKLHICL